MRRLIGFWLAVAGVYALGLFAVAQDIGGSVDNPTAPPDLSDFVRLNAEHTNDYTRFDVATGDATFIEKAAGLWLTAADMNTTNQYTAGLYFLSDDAQFTTESPKLLAGIVGRATEAYGSDIDSGMAVDIFASGINAGASDTSELVASFLPTGVALVPPLAFGAGAAIASSDDVCQSDGTNCPGPVSQAVNVNFANLDCSPTQAFTLTAQKVGRVVMLRVGAGSSSCEMTANSSLSVASGLNAENRPDVAAVIPLLVEFNGALTIASGVLLSNGNVSISVCAIGGTLPCQTSFTTGDDFAFTSGGDIAYPSDS